MPRGRGDGQTVTLESKLPSPEGLDTSPLLSGLQCCSTLPYHPHRLHIQTASSHHPWPGTVLWKLVVPLAHLSPGWPPKKSARLETFQSPIQVTPITLIYQVSVSTLAADTKPHSSLDAHLQEMWEMTAPTLTDLDPLL